MFGFLGTLQRTESDAAWAGLNLKIFDNWRQQNTAVKGKSRCPCAETKRHTSKLHIDLVDAEANFFSNLQGTFPRNENSR